MTKVKINNKRFELQDDAALVLDDYIDMLILSNKTNKISDNDFNNTCEYIENKLLDHLNNNSEITIDDINNILQDSYVKSKIYNTTNKWFFWIIIDFVWKIFSLFIRLIYLFVRFIVKFIVVCFNFFVFICCIVWVLSLVFIIPLLYLDIRIYWQEVLVILPNILKLSLIFLQVSFIIFGILFLGLVINKKLMPRFVWIIWVIIMILWFNWLVYSIADIRLKYWHQELRKSDFSFIYTWNQNLQLKWFDKDNSNIKFMINNIPFNRIKIENYSWESIQVNVDSYINISDKDSANYYFDKVWKEYIEMSWNTLYFHKSETLGNLPFSFFRRDILIKKPNNININYQE